MRRFYENVEKFLPVIWKYTDLTELNAHVLNELIEKVVVHEKVMAADGSKSQQVDIYYKFIGCINQKRSPASYTAPEKAARQECLHSRALRGGSRPQTALPDTSAPGSGPEM